MPLNYKPEEKIDSPRAEAGTYSFKVDDVTEKTFSSGNEGLSVKFLVAVSGERDVTVYSNFVYVPKALWKLKEFMDSIGVDFEQPPEPWELVNKTGTAAFVVGEKGYLEVDTFIPADTALKASVSKPAKDEPLSDNVPF
jgi:hypothetical protein